MSERDDRLSALIDRAVGGDPVEPEFDPLDYAQIEAYVNGDASPVDREIVESRMALDPALAQEVRDMQAVRAEMLALHPVLRPAGVEPETAKPKANWFAWLGLPALGAAAGVAVLALILGPQLASLQNRLNEMESQVAMGDGLGPGPGPGAGAVVDQTPPPALGQNPAQPQPQPTAPGTGTLTPTPAPTAEEVTVLAASEEGGLLIRWNGKVYRTAPVEGFVLEAFQTGELGSSPALESFAASYPVPKGGPGIIQSPSETGVRADRPAFQWERAEGATYTVRLRSMRESTFSTEERDVSPGWQPRVGLAAGEAYLWQLVESVPGAADRTFEARFFVLSEREAAQLDAGLGAATTELERAIWLARAGLRDEAIALLRTQQGEYPKRWVDQLLRAR